MKVLIVDDEEVLRRLVRLTLEDVHEVREAHDGPSALEEIRNHGPFDVVLLDHRLPGPSGVDLLPEIRLQMPAARVVMITAYTSLDLASAALARGASHFLAKPITPALLRAAVAAAAPHVQQPAAAPSGEHAITLNGFALAPGARARVERDGSATHVFSVSQVVAGWTRDVEVRIARDAFRHSGRPDLPPAGRLAGLVARRALADLLWRDGLVPEGGGLRLDEITPEQLTAALRNET